MNEKDLKEGREGIVDFAVELKNRLAAIGIDVGKSMSEEEKKIMSQYTQDLYNEITNNEKVIPIYKKKYEKGMNILVALKGKE